MADQRAELLVHDCDAPDAGDGVYCVACCPCDDCMFDRTFPLQEPAARHLQSMKPRRPCDCGHGITKHRDRLADPTSDGRQTDRNTSCTLCGCGEFEDANSREATG
jgi:hypothetical protein